jgi:hypothetical protein
MGRPSLTCPLSPRAAAERGETRGAEKSIAKTITKYMIEFHFL